MFIHYSQHVLSKLLKSYPKPPIGDDGRNLSHHFSGSEFWPIRVPQAALARLEELYHDLEEDKDESIFVV